MKADLELSGSGSRRVVRPVSELFRAPGLWTWLFDLLARFLHNAGDWCQCCAFAVEAGVGAYLRRRAVFRRKRARRIPAYASRMDVREIGKMDLEDLEVRA